MADQQKHDQRTTELPAAPAGGNETILLVDDENLLRELTQEFLTEAGYAVLTAEDGQKALAVYQEAGNGIDLVILDLIMPELSGAECFEELRKINPEVKVLVASGHVASDQIQQLVKSGAKGFVKKPYSLAEMLKSIRAALDPS